MTKLKVVVGIDPKTARPLFAYVHPFLAGAIKREQRVPETHITKKTKRAIPAFRVIHRDAFKPVRQEKYNRANR